MTTNQSYQNGYREAYIDALSSKKIDEVRAALLAIMNLEVTEAIPKLRWISQSKENIWEIRILAEKVIEYLEEANSLSKQVDQIV